MLGGGKQKEALLTKYHVPELLLRAGLPVPFDNLEATLLPAVRPMEPHFIVEKRSCWDTCMMYRVLNCQ